MSEQKEKPDGQREVVAWPRRFLPAGVVIVAILTGCKAPDRTASRHAADSQDMLAMLMPSRIQIVEPFTRVVSADQDDIPDHIELWVQGVNSLGSTGLMIAGMLRVELFEHIPASGLRQGRRFEHWNIELTSKKEQRNYWNAITQMYEFRLGINSATIPRANKYVLTVTYPAPSGERLTDEMIIRRNTTAAPP